MMSTARLRVIHSREIRNRKFVCVMNDVAKTQQDLYDGYIDKEKVESTQRLQKSIVFTRRNVVRQRVLKQCMESARQEVEQKHTSGQYGKYRGVPVEHIAGDIDTRLEKNHPRIRRKQKIHDLFEKGYESGAILEDEKIKEKVDDYFDKPLVHVHHIPEKSLGESSNQDSLVLPPIAEGFYTGNLNKNSDLTDRKRKASKNAPRPTNETEAEARLFVNRKVSKFLTEDVPDNISLHSTVPSVRSRRTKDVDMRPSTLPPIKPADMEEAESPPKPGSIGDLVAKFKRSKEKQMRADQRFRPVRRSRPEYVHPEHQGGGPETKSKPELQDRRDHHDNRPKEDPHGNSRKGEGRDISRRAEHSDKSLLGANKEIPEESELVQERPTFDRKERQKRRVVEKVSIEPFRQDKALGDADPNHISLPVLKLKTRSQRKPKGLGSTF